MSAKPSLAGRGASMLPALALALSASGCSPEPPNPDKPSSYTELCATALTKVQFSTHQIEHASLVPIDPVIILRGPPPRVQCGISEGTYIGGVTFDVICNDWQSNGCVHVTAAVMDGRVIYMSEDARKALEGTPAGHKHHHHRN